MLNFDFAQRHLAVTTSRIDSVEDVPVDESSGRVLADPRLG